MPDPHLHPPWQKAASAAARFHRHQVRKDGVTPYAAHPFRVAMTVRDLFGVSDPVAVAAALLHDVIEDTTGDYDDIAKEFGTEVADTVAALTKDMRLPEREREVAYDEQLRQGPWQAKLIKLADVYDNVSDSSTGGVPTKAIQKARRAIELAGSDERLAGAVALVRRLVAEVENR
jgi:guanosine-3',5'-bis(diphosphate) 3'-pyrophosphohydrolase